MLIHISPKLYVSFCRRVFECDVVDVSIPEVGLILRGGKDIVARRPYPEKQTLVVCRKRGRHAINGILVETEQFLPSFTVITRWAVDAEVVTTHRVRYMVMDSDYDAVSDNIMLWGPRKSHSECFESRVPPYARKNRTGSVEPQMTLLLQASGDDDVPKNQCAWEWIDGNGLVRERIETFRMPTIQRDRLTPEWSLDKRFPEINTVFAQEANQHRDLAGHRSMAHVNLKPPVQFH
jgi:hypothetical protein